MRKARDPLGARAFAAYWSGGHAHVEAALGVLGPDSLLIELADRGLRHRLDEGPPLRQLPPGDRRAEEVAQVLRGDRVALTDHDRRKWTLAPPLVRYADDARLQHGRVGHQRVLQLHRADPLAAGLDDVLGPVGQRQVPVGREHADIAGSQPAVGAELLRVGLGVAEVRLRDPRAADLELADRLAVVGHHRAVRADDAGLDTGGYP